MIVLLQMKLVLLLLSGLVGVSYQDGYYAWPMPYTPRAHYQGLFYGNGQPANQPKHQIKVSTLNLHIYTRVSA